MKLKKPSIFALLPAYALSEIKSAFKIGFGICPCRRRPGGIQRATGADDDDVSG